MKKILFSALLLLTPSIYCPTQHLSVGEVGSKDDVYAKLMEQVSGFEDPQYFNEGLPPAVERALNNSRVNLSHLSLEEYEEITVFELYNFDDAWKKLRGAMIRHKQKQKKRGLWKEPEAPKVDEKDTTISKLVCCENYLHQRCLKAYLETKKICFLCSKTEEDGFSHRPSGKHNFSGDCPICQEKLPEPSKKRRASSEIEEGEVNPIKREDRLTKRRVGEQT